MYLLLKMVILKLVMRKSGVYDEIFLMIAYDGPDFLSELATDSSVRHVPGMEIQCR